MTSGMTSLQSIQSRYDAKRASQRPGGETEIETALEQTEPLRLPPWDSVRASDPPKRNPPLINGIVRRGHVMLISGKGKGSKTFTAVESSVAVATGGSWFGFICERGDVLYIDPELDYKSLDNRFHEVAERVGANQAEVDAHVKKWCLRGVLTARGDAPTAADLAHDVAINCTFGDFALVVVDSASCFIQGDENSAGDVRRFFGHVMRIAEATGAAVLTIHHMGKGNKGDVDSIERSRGSAVWGDAPDAPLSLLEIFPPTGEVCDYLKDGARAFMLEDSGLREYPGITPRHVIFDYPIHRVDYEGITEGWKPKSGQQTGGKRGGATNRQKSADRASKCELAIAAEFIAQGIGKEGMSASEAAELVSERIGETVKAQTLKTYIEASEHFDVEQVSSQRWRIIPKRAPQELPPPLFV